VKQNTFEENMATNYGTDIASDPIYMFASETAFSINTRDQLEGTVITILDFFQQDVVLDNLLLTVERAEGSLDFLVTGPSFISASNGQANLSFTGIAGSFPIYSLFLIGINCFFFLSFRISWSECFGASVFAGLS
jgi:hypothetical protein